ncbi:MAG: Dabb family protein [Clostridia bacterium]|nr:Dabb family protein [Clostridia bacterium]
MIKHIVLWKFQDEAQGHTKEENMEIIRAALTSLVPIIPQIRSFEIGKDVLHSEMSYDMALIMTFDSLEDLEAYKTHPEHRKVSAYVKQVRESRVSADFVI